MLTKMKAVFNVFKKGEQVADPATWKNRQIAGNALALLLMALAGAAKVFGYDLGVTDAQLESAAYGAMAILGVVNTVLTAVTSKKVGVGKAEE